MEVKSTRRERRRLQEEEAAPRSWRVRAPTSYTDLPRLPSDRATALESRGRGSRRNAATFRESGRQQSSNYWRYRAALPRERSWLFEGLLIRQAPGAIVSRKKPRAYLLIRSHRGARWRLDSALAPASDPTAGRAKSQVAFGINVAEKGLWRKRSTAWEKAIELDPKYAEACTTTSRSDTSTRGNSTRPVGRI